MSSISTIQQQQIAQLLDTQYTAAQNRIEYILGFLEDEENIQSEDTLYETLAEILIEQLPSVKNKQIARKLCHEIISILHSTKDIDQAEGEQQDQDESESNLIEESKSEQQVATKNKNDFSHNSEFLDRDEIHTLEELKKEQELAEKYGCVLCERIVPLTFHHLIPRTTHKKNFNRGRNVTELNQGIWLCRQCHSGVHNLIDEETLAKEFFTLELLLANESVLKMAKYMSKQKLSGKAEKRMLQGSYTLKQNNK